MAGCRSRANPARGVRDTADLRAAAADHDLTLDRIVDMPSNNVIVIFERSVGNSE